jgi:hypothetical protein
MEEENRDLFSREERNYKEQRPRHPNKWEDGIGKSIWLFTSYPVIWKGMNNIAILRKK